MKEKFTILTKQASLLKAGSLKGQVQEYSQKYNDSLLATKITSVSLTKTGKSTCWIDAEESDMK